MKIYLVSDNVDTLVGMRLAGIEGCVVHEQGELKKAIDHALEDRNPAADGKVRKRVSRIDQ